MATSANVTKFYVYRNGEQIARIHQNWLCKVKYEDELRQISNPEECTLQSNTPDEDEVDHWKEHGKLSDYIAMLDKRVEERRRSGKIWTKAREIVTRDAPNMDPRMRIKLTREMANQISHAVGEDHWEEKLKHYK